MKTVVTLGIIACSVTLATAAIAADYPTRPVRIIVPFGAGSATDVVARTVGQNLGEALGQAMVIDNRAGANGTIGAELAAKSPKDGYTLLMSTNTPSAAAPSLMKKINYDPVKDFAPIARIGTIAFVLVTNPSLPAKSMKELIALAKQQPGKLTAGSGSAGSLVPVFMLQQMAGIELNHVPYKSIPPALADVISGQINMVYADMVTGSPQVKSGKVRALGVTSMKRDPLLPDVPAIAETVKGFELIAWFALFAPAGTPSAVVDRLSAESQKILARSDVRERFAVMGIQVAPLKPAELGEFQKSELVKWSKLAKAANIIPE
ncbi:MAG: tripartite tricarboxylate transporter substrate binding protein [Burkholderiales bacterium]|jgi:tripartite-type tricarboxylate transporter receptor subunit TctC|nr:tripartite tricarboxylate transporter substrate binding protein [Burkholderiales bacterium]